MMAVAERAVEQTASALAGALGVELARERRGGAYVLRLGAAPPVTVAYAQTLPASACSEAAPKKVQ
jgi:hypothetical protein